NYIPNENCNCRSKIELYCKNKSVVAETCIVGRYMDQISLLCNEPLKWRIGEIPRGRLIVREVQEPRTQGGLSDLSGSETVWSGSISDLMLFSEALLKWYKIRPEYNIKWYRNVPDFLEWVLRIGDWCLQKLVLQIRDCIVSARIQSDPCYLPKDTTWAVMVRIFGTQGMYYGSNLEAMRIILSMPWSQPKEKKLVFQGIFHIEEAVDTAQRHFKDVKEMKEPQIQIHFHKNPNLVCYTIVMLLILKISGLELLLSVMNCCKLAQYKEISLTEKVGERFQLRRIIIAATLVLNGERFQGNYGGSNLFPSLTQGDLNSLLEASQSFQLYLLTLERVVQQKHGEEFLRLIWDPDINKKGSEWR
ncbi:hypothetical protein KI387_032007, partial [Taxus chinensis]